MIKNVAVSAVPPLKKKLATQIECHLLHDEIGAMLKHDRFPTTILHTLTQTGRGYRFVQGDMYTTLRVLEHHIAIHIAVIVCAHLGQLRNRRRHISF